MSDPPCHTQEHRRMACSSHLCACHTPAGSRVSAQAVCIISPVSTRAVLGIRSCGMSFTSPQAFFDPAEPFSLWDTARSMRQEIQKASTREALTAITTAMQGMIAAGLTRAGAADMLRSVLAQDFLLSNLGRMPFDSTFGHLRLDSLWGPAVLSGAVGTTASRSGDDKRYLMPTPDKLRPTPQLLEVVKTIFTAACQA